MTHRADAKAMLDDRGYTGPLVRGGPPHQLLEEAVRNRITESYYWKEQCFGLNAATLCDRAAALTSLGGTYDAGRRATPFLCLALKLLQLHPSEAIVREYLAAGAEEGAEEEEEEELGALHDGGSEGGDEGERKGSGGGGGEGGFKYLRALAAFYVRLTSERSEDVYRLLEPLLRDGRKLRRRGNAGWALTWVDQFVDDLLCRERVCATSLWKLVPREQLEDEGRLEERVSPLAHLLDDDDDDDGGGGGGTADVEEVDAKAAAGVRVGSEAEEEEERAANGVNGVRG